MGKFLKIIVLRGGVIINNDFILMIFFGKLINFLIYKISFFYGNFIKSIE